MARAPVASIEVGGSGVQTVLFDDAGGYAVHEGASAPAGYLVLIATPGLIDGGRVSAANNLGWLDSDPAVALGLDRSAQLVINDAEAAALGESALRDGAPDLLYLGLGTGLGAAVVRDGAAVGNLLAHGGGDGPSPCTCGSTGCLETVVGGWALADSLDREDLEAVAAALAAAVQADAACDPELVVVAGGLTAAYPSLITLLAALLPARRVEPTAAPPGVKSAAAWGLCHAWAAVARSA